MSCAPVENVFQRTMLNRQRRRLPTPQMPALPSSSALLHFTPMQQQPQPQPQQPLTYSTMATFTSHEAVRLAPVLNPMPTTTTIPSGVLAPLRSDGISEAHSDGTTTASQATTSASRGTESPYLKHVTSPVDTSPTFATPPPPTRRDALAVHDDRTFKKTRFVPRGRRTSPNSTLPCPICHQLYSRRDNLRTHMRIHSKEKPYSCSVCDTRFRWLGALRSHEAMHRRREGRVLQARCRTQVTQPALPYPYTEHVDVHATEQRYMPVQTFTTQPRCDAEGW